MKQQMIYKLWKLRSNTLIMNRFILTGMVTRRSRHWVPWRYIKSLFFNINYSLYFDTQKVHRSQLAAKTFFYTCVWISNLRWKKSFFKYIYATLRNNVRQLLIAMSIGFKHIFPLCLSTLYHEKQVI